MSVSENKEPKKGGREQLLQGRATIVLLSMETTGGDMMMKVYIFSLFFLFLLSLFFL